MVTTVEEPAQLAAAWLDRTYAGRVELADPQPFVEQPKAWLFACRYAEQPEEPMLAATLAVPKDGAEPFPVANADPLDGELNTPDGTDSWRRRVNARNCLIAAEATFRRQPTSALPWHPEDETPGWWDRLLDEFFPDAERGVCATWSQVASAVAAGGPGTNAVVWLRRQRDGVPITGHLLYVRYWEGRAVVLDAVRGDVASTDDSEVAELRVARFHRPEVDAAAAPSYPWQRPAPDFESAVAKANEWLEHAYSGAVVLVDPAPVDETHRGWLFACTTRAFAETGEWREQMLDAALVVPKAAGESPFGLPNSDPWPWMARWDDGEPDLPDPPASGSAAWFAVTMEQIGEVVSVHEYAGWAEAMEEIVNLSEGARAVIWVRRKDYRDRETVGNLIVLAVEEDGVRFVDGMAENGTATFEANAAGVHVIRYR
ncbi:YrhB domain-containing protein [Amycolatopsis samaneae]|uniref:YrhB domain-containing protein n=1 Tax=Amycolatopsis samaneae TaxID=664691 RepID=A0ABW5GSE2_9PSEU